MVKMVVQCEDHATTHVGKKYPWPHAPAAYKPLKRVRGVPSFEETTTPGVSVIASREGSHPGSIVPDRTRSYAY